MNGLIAHPDVIRWFIWSWQPDSRAATIETLASMIKCIATAPIEITVTNNDMTIFKGTRMNITTCPPIVKTYFDDLLHKKEAYFDSCVVNHIFKNISYTQFRYDTNLQENIDRVGWITWTIYWLIKFQPAKFFILKDILLVSLNGVGNVHFKSRNVIPDAPWITSRPNNIQSIYDAFDKSIYYACFGS